MHTWAFCVTGCGDSMCCFVCPRVSLMHAVFVAADSRPKISPSPITGILSVTIILTGATKTSTQSEKIHSPSQQNIPFPSKTKLGIRKGEAIVGLKVSGCLRLHEAVCKCAHQCHPRVHLRFKLFVPDGLSGIFPTTVSWLTLNWL